MPGIKSFFKVDANRTAKRRVTDLIGDDSDSDIEVVDVADVKTTPKKESQSDSKRLKPSPRKTPVKPPRETVTPKQEIHTSNKSKYTTDVSRSPSKASKASSVNTSPTKSPVKSTPIKSTPGKSSPAKSSPAKVDGATTASILESIPSVDISHVDTSAKPNWKQSQVKSDDSGMEVTAAPNCLAGLTFVVTGTLPNLGREEISGIIKRYGGTVTSSLSGRTSCMVVGEDAGPSKIQKARSLKLKVIDEAGFLELLSRMPADGGSGEAAVKARAKRDREQEVVVSQAKKLGPLSANSGNNELWTSKYAPKQISDICGNNAGVQRLSAWLRDWKSARAGNSKSEGSQFRAAMLSGPPGIGKTTAAHLVGILQGFDVVEYNASDTRSKSLLNQQVAQTLSNRTLSGTQSTQNLLVIMDEVDGMSAGDRGGVGAMAALARTTNVPLILICNERTLPKMRPFDRVVFDIPFRRPDESQVRQRLQAVARAEGLALDSAAVGQLVATTRSDIRQMLNLLETFSTTEKEMSYDGCVKFSQKWNKEQVLKPFDIAGRLLSTGVQRSMSTNERMELYFHDYDIAPLMIQENYLVTAPSVNAVADAASAISDGDLVDHRIHGPQQQWSLMPIHALMSCVVPSFYAAGHAKGRYNFTAYLGNNSKGLKYRRLLAELRSHIRLRLGINAVDLRLELQPLLAEMLLNPLLECGAEGIPEVIAFMDQYFITREDWDVVMELGVGRPSSEDRAKKVPPAVKTAFTRKYNAMSHPLPFMKVIDTKAAPAAKVAPDFGDVIVEDIEVEEDEVKEDDLEKAVKTDKYIKAAKPKASAKVKPKGTAKPRAHK